MKAIGWRGDIDAEALGFFIDQLNDTEPEESVCIYIDSSGGQPDCSDAIIDVIDRFSEDRNLTLAAYWEISSAAFQIFMKSRCEKVVLPGAHAIVHKTTHRNNTLMMDRGDPLHVGVACQNEMLQVEKLSWFSSIELTESEMSVIKNNGDVYLNAKRLREIVNNIDTGKLTNQNNK